MGEYNYDWVKQDRQNYGKGESTVVSSSSLIPVRGTNFASMSDASAIDSMKASAPAYHQNIDRALKVSGKVRDEDRVSQQQVRAHYIPKREIEKGFVNGAPVIDAQGRKLIIIHASAGHIKKSRTVVHRVANKAGESWLEKETNLRLRM